MDYFALNNGTLYGEQVSLEALALQYQTPLYVYSRAALENSWRAFAKAFAFRRHLICFAVKANSNLAVLNVLAKLGSGFDIVSQGELERVLAAGGLADKVVFSGVGKSASEMARALEVGIRCFNVESSAELLLLDEVAGSLNKVAPVSLRINPDVDAKTHPYIATGLKENKFGIAYTQARALFLQAHKLPNIKITGIDCHIGSQLLELAPFVSALQRLVALIVELREDGIAIEHLDLGGGLGVAYGAQNAPTAQQYADALRETLQQVPELEIILEPGRAIAANAGVLLTRVMYLKHTEHKNFAIVDAAMNDLIRPALYQAWQQIVPVTPKEAPRQIYDVVGPVCETGDHLGKGRELALQQGDLLAVRGAGAYGFVMSSNYNSRVRAAEVMVNGAAAHLVRQRESLDSLWQLEQILPK
ncbi:MAG: diaminopimelate decarboxylase [Vibrionaceae bacterium]